MNNKKLYKSNNRKIAGVCGGIAEYFEIDPTLVRLIWALVFMVGGSGLLLYIIAAVLMEDAPDYQEDRSYSGYNSTKNFNYDAAKSDDSSKDSDEVVGFKYEEK